MTRRAVPAPAAGARARGRSRRSEGTGAEEEPSEPSANGTTEASGSGTRGAGSGARGAGSGAPGPIPPYGGRLVHRATSGSRAEEVRQRARDLPSLEIDPRTVSDLYLLAVGALSPLDGFMDAETYGSVLEEMCLPGGLPWSVPIVLPAQKERAGGLRPGSRVALRAPNGDVAGILEVTEIFPRDPEREAARVYGTTESAHPGVAALYAQAPVCIAGPVTWCHRSDISGFPGEHLTPAETRRRFDERGWKTVVAFQTRNPIHRAHEYIQKCALEVVDGLLLHPIVGETKEDDVPASVRMECYRVMLERYFPADRVLLSVLPAAMRYAGPREAIHHAIMRRNYGCTHFIVGRDHAGVGSYYGTYDAQKIFETLDGEALGIQPLTFEHAFWCRLTGQMGTSKTSPSAPEQRLFLSGTRVREMLSRGERPPEEFTRPEVADILMRAYRGDAGG